jgi:hypothetical protein
LKHVEVDEESYTYPAHPHIGEELGFVDRMHGLHRFDFDHNSVFDHQIDPVSNFEFLSLIYNWQRNFDCDFEPAASQLVCKAGLVGAFQESWAKEVWTFIGEFTTAPVISFTR